MVGGTHFPERNYTTLLGSKPTLIPYIILHHCQGITCQIRENLSDEQPRPRFHQLR